MAYKMQRYVRMITDIWAKVVYCMTDVLRERRNPTCKPSITLHPSTRIMHALC